MLPEKYRHKHHNIEKAFNHEECSDTKERLYVKHTSKGWLYHCHNCGKKFSGFQYKQHCSPSGILETLKNIHKLPSQVYREIELPYDFTLDIPKLGLAWLLRYITQEEIDTYEIGYSPMYDRVILPVFDGRELIFWQGRALKTPTKENPKYINVRAAGKNILFHTYESPSSGHAIIVEDVLSAIAVSRYAHGIALLGSYIADTILPELLDYEQISVWLDFDKAKESIKYSQRLTMFTGKRCNSIITMLDPKELTNEHIEMEINR